MSAVGQMLESINAIQRLRPNLGLAAVTTFLLVCEHEGVSLKELAFLSRSSESLVSRAITVLRSGHSGGSLVGTRRDEFDKRRSRVYLTEDGSALKYEIATLIAQ